MNARDTLRRVAGVAAICVAMVLPSTARAAVLSISEVGILLKMGTPYCAIGVNYYDAFPRHLADPQDRRYEQGFAELRHTGIPFARISATAYWPGDLRIYLTDRDEYLRRLDDVVRAAESSGIGLVMDLFWAWFAVPDVVGEPVNRWGDPNSATIRFMSDYTRDIVTRYRSSPAIWAWEFGNEYSLKIDLPDTDEWRPPVNTSFGTPPTRSPEDHFTTAMMLNAYARFAAVIRELDDRIVLTGNAMPRSQAEGRRLTGEWKPDSPSEFMTNLQLVNPSPDYQMVSVHLYKDEVLRSRFGADHPASYDDLLTLASSAARQNGQGLFVGEFGASSVYDGGEEAAIRENLEIIDALVRSHVPLSAVWTFDATSSPREEEGWNITHGQARGAILDAIGQANDRLAGGACTTH